MPSLESLPELKTIYGLNFIVLLSAAFQCQLQLCQPKNTTRNKQKKCLCNGSQSPVRELLSKAEVGQADVAFTVQQDILRLQVAVHDLFGVEVLYGAYNLRGIKEAGGVTEAPAAAQVAKKLSAWHVVHQHVEEALVVVGPEPERSQGTKIRKKRLLSPRSLKPSNFFRPAGDHRDVKVSQRCLLSRPSVSHALVPQ